MELPANSTGINGVLADPHDGQTLDIEGPEHELQDENGTSGCCWLYSINLQTLEAKVAAGIWGTTSRRRFVDAEPSLMTAVADRPSAVPSLKMTIGKSRQTGSGGLDSEAAQLSICMTQPVTGL